MLKKIVVIGPESTGKSYLCEQLAAHYQTLWVKEYAREYLLANGKTYNLNTLLEIAKGQVAIEEKAVTDLMNRLNVTGTGSGHKPLFIDTDLYVMKVWSEFVFNDCNHWILNNIAKKKYDLYLLCNVDLPWVKDELREYPDQAIREKIYLHYKDILVNQQTGWVDISGNYEERLQKAISAADELINH